MKLRFLKGPKKVNRRILWLWKISHLVICSYLNDRGEASPQTCRPEPTNVWFDLFILVINYTLFGWAKKLKSSKCWWGHCALVMHAIFRICQKTSQQGLQLVEKLATPLKTVYLQKLKGMHRSELASISCSMWYHLYEMGYFFCQEWYIKG